MSARFDLKGLRVLNPRAEDQAAEQNQVIHAAQGIAIALPFMAIEGLSPHSWLPRIQPLHPFHSLIFTSSNAVDYFFRAVEDSSLSLPDRLSIWAIGPATARQVQRHQLSAQYPKIHSSEGLISEVHPQYWQSQNILLIKGSGGRKTLTDYLQKMAYTFVEVSVYQRVVQNVDQQKLKTLWLNDAVDIILGTSQFLIDAVFDQADDTIAQWLKGKIWVVFSPRLKVIAEQHGIKDVMVTQSDHLIKTLNSISQGLAHGRQKRNPNEADKQ
jgi:uroporphyrinogen-III synthase